MPATEPRQPPLPGTTEKPDAATAILDAAERIFADNGFHGATTRAIATQAQANAALIHYYFGTKEALFEAVIARRSGAINGERQATLARLRAASNPNLESVLDALLRPTITLGRDPSQSGAHYARLLAHAAAGTDDRSRRLTAKNYNDIALIFVDAIMDTVPGLSRHEAVHAYLNTIAIAISLMAPTGRAAVLGAPAPEDLDTIIDRAVRFIAAGIRSLATPPPASPDTPRATHHQGSRQR